MDNKVLFAQSSQLQKEFPALRIVINRFLNGNLLPPIRIAKTDQEQKIIDNLSRTLYEQNEQINSTVEGLGLSRNIVLSTNDAKIALATAIVEAAKNQGKNGGSSVQSPAPSDETPPKE